MPSTDAITRGKIAHLPPEVSDAAGAHTICIDSDATRDLLNKIKPALVLLKDYNVKLDKELEDRKDVSMKLQDLIYFQKDLLTQSEHRLEVSNQLFFKQTKKALLVKQFLKSGTPAVCQNPDKEIGRYEISCAKYARLVKIAFSDGWISAFALR
jgi:hypothetical protein